MAPGGLACLVQTKHFILYEVVMSIFHFCQACRERTKKGSLVSRQGRASCPVDHGVHSHDVCALSQPNFRICLVRLVKVNAYSRQGFGVFPGAIPLTIQRKGVMNSLVPAIRHAGAFLGNLPIGNTLFFVLLPLSTSLTVPCFPPWCKAVHRSRLFVCTLGD